AAYAAEPVRPAHGPEKEGAKKVGPGIETQVLPPDSAGASPLRSMFEGLLESLYGPADPEPVKPSKPVAEPAAKAKPHTVTPVQS
ncbi:MAG: hypothetical protein EAZ89_10070, partial [Bacteroidetes bacterium]